MKTLGPATEAALTRIVSTLPYLRSEASAVPAAHRSFWDTIKAKYAASHHPTDGDPLHAAALQHAKDELATAIEQDEKDESDKADEAAAEIQEEQPKPPSPEVMPGPVPASELDHNAESE